MGLASNSVPMMTKPLFETAILHSALVPYKHYLPLDDDFSDLQSVLDWASDNPTAVSKIAVEGQRYYKEDLKDDKRAALISQVVLAIYFDRVRVTYTAGLPEADITWRNDGFRPDPRNHVEDLRKKCEDSKCKKTDPKKNKKKKHDNAVGSSASARYHPTTTSQPGKNEDSEEEADEDVLRTQAEMMEMTDDR